MTPLLELRDVSCDKQGNLLFKHVNLAINQGDVVVFRGKSGSGKTTLLKCIAHLILYDGQVLYRGSSPKAHGIPSFRTRVLYVPQRPSMLPGSPRDFLNTATSFQAHKSYAHALKKEHNAYLDPFQRALDVSEKWDVDPQLWDREWSNLSGGEAQRLSLAIAIGLNSAEVLLLDEPTSALDSTSSSAIEDFLLHELSSPDTSLKAVIWITHSDEQGGRVGNRFVHITAGGVCEEPRPPV